MKYKLGDIVSFNYGKDFKDLETGNVPVFGSGGLMGKVDKFLHDGPSVLIPRLGSLNNVMYVERKFWTVNTLFWTIVDEKVVIPKYLYYMLKNVDLSSMNAGSAVPRLNVKILSSITLDIPPLDEQADIIEKLTIIENKINLNEKINKNLFKMAKIQYNLEFMDMIENHKVGEYITVKRGKNLKKRDTVPGKYPVVGGGIKESSYHNEYNTSKDVVTISSSGANAGFVNIWMNNIWASDSSFIDESVSDYVFFWYLYLLNHQTELFDSQTGSVQPHVYPKQIENLPIFEIDTTKIELFNRKVEKIFSDINNNLQENKMLNLLIKQLVDRYIGY